MTKAVRLSKQFISRDYFVKFKLEGLSERSMPIVCILKLSSKEVAKVLKSAQLSLTISYPVSS